ncbi:MAG: hypothetical protein KF866_03730 [Phycisphaeraceae bacterium]|nr:hypothetical protein [Phycisphaeraceae bacterium]MCW5753196.1 hypothetical protein [Phycisphaeraceae bacterium]
MKHRQFLPALVCGGVFALAGCEGDGGPLEPAKPIAPPAGATILADDVTPQFILAECHGRHGQVNEAALAMYVDCWVSERGWEGEVTWIEKTKTGTRFAIKIEDIRVPDDIFVRCEMPGEHYDLQLKGAARVRGRIKTVTYPKAAMQEGQRVYLDNVTVLHAYKPPGR